MQSVNTLYNYWKIDLRRYLRASFDANYRILDFWNYARQTGGGNIEWLSVMITPAFGITEIASHIHRYLKNKVSRLYQMNRNGRNVPSDMCARGKFRAAHPPPPPPPGSLIRVFSVRLKKHWALAYSQSAKWRFLSEYGTFLSSGTEVFKYRIALRLSEQTENMCFNWLKYTRKTNDLQMVLVGRCRITSGIGVLLVYGKATLYLLLALLSALGRVTGLWQGNVVLAACITFGIRVLLVYGKAMLYLLLALLSALGCLTGLWQGNVVLAACITFGITGLW